MQRWEHDPRIQYRPELHGDPRSVNSRVRWLLTGTGGLAAATIFLTLLAVALWPDRTDSGPSFSNSELCGGDVVGKTVRFRRVFFPEPLLESLRRPYPYERVSPTLLVDVRDDFGKVGEATWQVGPFPLDHAEPMLIDRLLKLDRPPISDVHCVAWGQFDGRGLLD